MMQNQKLNRDDAWYYLSLIYLVSLMLGGFLLVRGAIPQSYKLDKLNESVVRIEQQLKGINKVFIPEHKKWWRTWTEQK